MSLIKVTLSLCCCRTTFQYYRDSLTTNVFLILIVI